MAKNAKPKKQRTPKNPEGRMTLGEHLLELRNRLLISAAAVVVCAIAGWWIYYPVFDAIYHPFAQLAKDGYNVNLNFGGIGTTLEVHIRLAVYIGLGLASPIVLYQIWRFITPGLHTNEKKYAIGFVGASAPLFLIGCAAGYFATTKLVPVLLGFRPNSEVSQLVEFGMYLDLVIKVVLAFGLAFIYPVLLVALNMVGVLPARTMIKGWRWAIFLSFVFVAVLVPTPDPITLIAMSVPLIILFFAAVGISAVNDRRRAKREAALEADLDAGTASTIVDAPAPIDLPESVEDSYRESDR